MSKFTTLTDELHAYMVEHGARQDAALRRVQAETEAMGDIAVMQIAPDQGAFMTLLARSIGAREALEVGTFTGLLRDLHRSRTRPRRAADLLRAERGVRGDRGGATSRPPASRTGSRSGSARRSTRCGRCPRARYSTSPSSTPTRQSYPDYYEEALARTRPGGLVLHRQRAAQRHRRRPGPAGAGEDEQLRGTLKVNELVRDDDRVDVAMVGIADGLTIARKR